MVQRSNRDATGEYGLRNEYQESKEGNKERGRKRVRMRSRSESPEQPPSEPSTSLHHDLPSQSFSSSLQASRSSLPASPAGSDILLLAMEPSPYNMHNDLRPNTHQLNPSQEQPFPGVSAAEWAEMLNMETSPRFDTEFDLDLVSFVAPTIDLPGRNGQSLGKSSP
jgi:hypothetical protein